LSGELPLERAEAFSALFIRNLGPWGTILAISVLAGAALAPRFYCRRLCPLNPLFADIETVRNGLGNIRPSAKSDPGAGS